MLVLRVDSRNTAVIDLRPLGIGLIKVTNCGDKHAKLGFDCDPNIRIVRGKLFDEDERQRELAGLPEPSPATREDEWEQRWIATDLDLDLDIGNDISENDEEAA